MQCPLCVDESLEPLMRGGIEIDVCPRCRGVWLDRGEIDKLDSPTVRAAAVKHRSRDDRRERKQNDRDRSKSERRKRKKNFAARLADVLEDIID